MGLFGLFDKKNKPEKTVSVEPEYTKEDGERIAEVLNERFSQPVMRICFDSSAPESLTSSKVGGYPYWEKGKEYPVNSRGEKLVLLMQVNFSDEKLDNPFLLPSKGLLQFYIDTDDLNGLNFDDQTKQDGFRVIYFPDPDESIKETDIILMDIPANTSLRDGINFPVTKEIALHLEEGVDGISGTSNDFDDEAKKVFQELYGDYREGNLYRILGRECYDRLFECCSGFGSKMLGTPAFTQSDPRGEDDMHLTTLLQLDSDRDIMWGDSGIGNFFIDPLALKALDFSDVLYNWDCY